MTTAIILWLEQDFLESALDYLGWLGALSLARTE
jgi:hypothetical protein